ncbi:hypothetical protein B0A52_07462 [Exophiala mesophila]|uniref:DUF3669 domain-containing protein n=1 Tax=Exophiala mesophila TaxID=212818 RepID=A0A438MZB5_EXOME|nr:hypothetical protein B0A52_07462 [Exophiala mesophila]
MMVSGLRYAGDLSGLSFIDDMFLKQHGSKQLLCRMFSTKSYLSTSSSLAKKLNDAQAHHELRNFVEIGKGQTGTVWALTGTDQVIKVANQNRSEGLWNDFLRHMRVESAFQSTSIVLRREINIPRVGDWVSPTNELFWGQSLPLLPPGSQPDHGFISSRIFPLPLPIREAIIDEFAPRSIKRAKASFLQEPASKDCLVRLYLGRRTERTGAFKLRNFDMAVNEMEHLGLDTKMYAIAMAKILAIMHWKAGLDANDVEIVLGSSPKIKMRAALSDYENTTLADAMLLGQEFDFEHRSVGIWLLDFDQCQEFSKDNQGVQQLVRGFFWNDPYYPRPHAKDSRDVALWTEFRDAYLKVSKCLTDTDMPGQFINAVEAEGLKRSAGASLFQ